MFQNVIGRCSQPLIGPNGRRSREDEKIMAAFNVKGTRGQKGYKKGRSMAAQMFKIINHGSLRPLRAH